jgi:hypothetical protein
LLILLGSLEICNITRSKYMSDYLPKLSLIKGADILVAIVITTPAVARSQGITPPEKTTDKPFLTNPAERINKNIEKNYPPELIGEEKPTPTKPTSTTATPNSNTTAIGSSNYTFVLSTPVMIAIVVVVGGIALFPVLHLLLNSKKTIAFVRSSPLAKLFDKVQKPKVLESDEFLHQRNFEQLTVIAKKAEGIHSEKFGNNEFTTLIKIESYIHRSIDEYAGLNDCVTMLEVAIAAQNSFLTIEGSESRYCSSTQQELYKLVNTLLQQELDPEKFKQQVNHKLTEVLPLLKTEEGKIALQAYTTEVIKISRHPLGLKLLLLFKQYQFDDFSTLRSVTNTINQLKNEDLLNLDALLLLVMVKYDIFEKLGPIIGISDEYNRPETYAKMLQYIGLKSQHQVSYGKFNEFLALIKKMGIHYQTIINVRKKYETGEHRLPKNFTAAIPSVELYHKYKENLPLIEIAAKLSSVVKAEIPAPAWDIEEEKEEILMEVK